MMRAYEVRTPIHGPGESSTYYADNHGQARMACLRNAWDAGYEITFKDVRVRSLGLRETPHEKAQRRCDAFNARHNVGDLLKCYPLIPPNVDDESRVKVLAIREPMAFVNGGDYAVVAVTGDVWALDAVTEA